MFRTKVVLAAVALKRDQHQEAAVICKPSELPIYPRTTSAPESSARRSGDSFLHQKIASGVGVVREEVQKSYSAVAKQTEGITDYIHIAKAHAQQTIDKLNEPQNTVHRGGAIALGGLAGFIFAARGGIFKKVIYTSIGALSIASICYPKQAEEQARQALYEGRKAFAVAYNFVKGVKPGDELPVEPVAKFPTSLQDLKFIIYDLYDDAKDILFPEKK